MSNITVQFTHEEASCLATFLDDRSAELMTKAHEVHQADEDASRPFCEQAGALFECRAKLLGALSEAGRELAAPAEPSE